MTSVYYAKSYVMIAMIRATYVLTRMATAFGSHAKKVKDTLMVYVNIAEHNAEHAKFKQAVLIVMRVMSL